MGAYLRDARDSSAYERALALFPRLRERLGQSAGTLSGGEQQMLAIGRALMAQPRLLLLDEPSLGLAPLLVQQIFAIIQEINAQGTTVVLVEQNARQALRVAQRAYVLETGAVTLSGAAPSSRATSACGARISAGRGRRVKLPPSSSPYRNADSSDTGLAVRSPDVPPTRKITVEVPDELLERAVEASERGHHGHGCRSGARAWYCRRSLHRRSAPVAAREEIRAERSISNASAKIEWIAGSTALLLRSPHLLRHERVSRSRRRYGAGGLSALAGLTRHASRPSHSTELLSAPDRPRQLSGLSTALHRTASSRLDGQFCERAARLQRGADRPQASGASTRRRADRPRRGIDHQVRLATTPMTLHFRRVSAHARGLAPGALISRGVGWPVRMQRSRHRPERRTSYGPRSRLDRAPSPRSGSTVASAASTSRCRAARARVNPAARHSSRPDAVRTST